MVARSGKTVLTDELRECFARAADVLIPRFEAMPAASEVDVQGETLDAVLAVRPEAKDDFMRALEYLAKENVDMIDALNGLASEDEQGFSALTLVASGGYYMSADVWKALGYPGQEYAPVDQEIEITPEYLVNRMLEKVSRRGPIYRTSS